MGPALMTADMVLPAEADPTYVAREGDGAGVVQGPVTAKAVPAGEPLTAEGANVGSRTPT